MLFTREVSFRKNLHSSNRGVADKEERFCNSGRNHSGYCFKGILLLLWEPARSFLSRIFH